MRIALSHSGGKTLAESFDGVLFDLDGVVYRGGDAVEHAVEAIGSLQTPTGFVTNNASRSPGEVARHLRALGIPAEKPHITTSAQAAAGLIVHLYGTGSRVLMIGGAGLRNALEEHDLHLVGSAEEAPEVVVQGNSRHLTWSDLAEAVYAINNGSGYIATNLDSTMPTERGLTLGNGALVKAVAHATGVEPTHTAGKPQPRIFTHAASQRGMAEPLVVGDRLDTDIRGANAAGIPGLVVLTGVASARDILASHEEERPSYIAHDLRGLHQVHPATEPARVGWRCNDAYANVTGGELAVQRAGRQQTLTGSGDAAEISLDELRAACGAAWTSEDALTFDREIHIHE